MQVGFLAEIPTNVVAAGSGSTAYLAQPMLVFLAQKAHFAGPDIVGQANHGPNVVGGHEVVGDDHGVGDALKEALRH